VLAREHLPALGRVDLLLEVLETALKVGADVLAGLCPLEQHAEIVTPALERLQQVELDLDAAAPLHDLLRLCLVAPEAGRAYVLFDVGKLLVEAGSFKDASAARILAGSGRRSVVRSRRDRKPMGFSRSG
jgi:hypothetical protein